MEEFKIIAKTFQGLEEVLAKELINLGANNVEIGRRMVSFTGGKEMLYKANFCLRTAVKVLKPIKEFKATDADEVYEVVKQMEWSDYMDKDNTFLVDAVVFSEKFRHSKFVAYRTKDAIADYFREKTGERPNVGITNPDLRINVHIAEDEVTISLDSSGESLHRRGYRQDSVAAPLNEVLAAGMIMLTGWDGECDLIDPMCGSGTILIEAALIAQNIYPGVFRKEFAFERWKDFDADLFDQIYNDDSQEREFYHKIYGYDINRKAVASALENVRSAGVSSIVEVEQRDFYNFEQPVEKSIMITNPPYGERITTNDILGLYEAIGERLKHAFVGNDAWVLSYHDECFAKIGMRPSTKYALYNGALECEFRKYQIFDGKLSQRREEGMDIKSDDDRKRNLKFKPHRHKDEGAEGDKRTGYGRGERKTDNEDHYFKSRPFEGKRRSKFDDGSDTELDRHSYKWGDRKASDYKGDERKTDSNPFGKRESRGERKPFERKEGGKPFGERKERKSFDGERRERKPFGGERGDRKPFGGKRDGKPFDKKRGERRNDRKDNREPRNTKWGFDSEGRPFRRNSDED